MPRLRRYLQRNKMNPLNDAISVNNFPCMLTALVGLRFLFDPWCAFAVPYQAITQLSTIREATHDEF